MRDPTMLNDASCVGENLVSSRASCHDGWSFPRNPGDAARADTRSAPTRDALGPRREGAS